MRSFSALFRGLGLGLTLLATACASGRAEYPTTEGPLALDRVVLYRNGVGYFERHGEVDGDRLRIKVRKDQVNDLLKSLTVVEREGGKAVSISMPLDPQTWANAALATLSPGRGNLADVLDALRGTTITVRSSDGTVATGRIVMVEKVEGETPPMPPMPMERMSAPPYTDHKLTLLEGEELSVVTLSKVQSLTLEDGSLALQLHRSLDASAGEGMFQQVEVEIRLAGKNKNDLLVSYVAPAPMWKPTYRIVLPKGGKGKALLQGWAVVDNTSGEDWRDVQLGLTSGAPIAFRYDLHTPRTVERPDLTEAGVRRQARAVLGESTYDDSAAEKDSSLKLAEQAGGEGQYGYEVTDEEAPAPDAAGPMGGMGRAASRSAADKKGSPRPSATSAAVGRPPMAMPAPAAPPPPPGLDMDSLRRSTLAQAKAASASGLTRFDLQDRVTVPDGTSTMVAVINQDVDGEETFLYRPGGAGSGYEANPYRVVRFKNITPFVLEPGPIAIFSEGSFVGEGLSEAVGAGTSATIPFAVEPDILVTSTTKYDGDEQRLVKLVRGILEIERFNRTSTTWTVKSATKKEGFTVLVRHGRAGYNYTLRTRPEGTEDLPDAYLVPVKVAPGGREASLEVVEQTPSRTSISIFDFPALKILETVLAASDVSPEVKKRLEPIVKLRQDLGRIDELIDGITRQRQELDQRAEETRQNLESLKRDPQAGALRARLGARLEQFTQDGDKLGRQLVELQSKRMETKIALQDAVQDLDLSVEAPKKP
jgi:hypothetical protein